MERPHRMKRIPVHLQDPDVELTTATLCQHSRRAANAPTGLGNLDDAMATIVPMSPREKDRRAKAYARSATRQLRCLGYAQEATSFSQLTPDAQLWLMYGLFRKHYTLPDAIVILDLHLETALVNSFIDMYEAERTKVHGPKIAAQAKSQQATSRRLRISPRDATVAKTFMGQIIPCEYTLPSGRPAPSCDEIEDLILGFDKVLLPRYARLSWQSCDMGDLTKHRIRRALTTDLPVTGGFESFMIEVEAAGGSQLPDVLQRADNSMDLKQHTTQEVNEEDGHVTEALRREKSEEWPQEPVVHWSDGGITAFKPGALLDHAIERARQGQDFFRWAPSPEHAPEADIIPQAHGPHVGVTNAPRATSVTSHRHQSGTRHKHDHGIRMVLNRKYPDQRLSAVQQPAAMDSEATRAGRHETSTMLDLHGHPNGIARSQRFSAPRAVGLDASEEQTRAMLNASLLHNEMKALADEQWELERQEKRKSVAADTCTPNKRLRTKRSKRPRLDAVREEGTEIKTSVHDVADEIMAGDDVAPDRSRANTV